MTPDTRFDEYLEVFNSRVRDRRLGEVEASEVVVPINPRETAFTEVFIETLEDIGQISGLEGVFFEKKLGRANAKVNAYGVSEDESRVDLAVTIHDQESYYELPGISLGRIEDAIRKAIQIFRAAGKPIHETMEPSSGAYDMMERIHQIHDQTNALRILVLIAGLAKKTPSFDSPDDLPDTQVDIWDLERLFRADASGLAYESFTIDLVDHLGSPLPCLEARPTAGDHRCYLAILPGTLLHDLYHKHGPRLLELNVRSFLQARGKVNRGIRDTLQNDPGHFLPFNNGISVTVEELDLVQGPDGSTAIRSMRGLQVVNGGQTVASIHRAHERDGVDLSQVCVQAKITVVEPEYLDSLVPFISRYSNTQNRVNETDFSANHPFHVRFQKLSEQIWAPGEMSRWFYERARGQWEVARSREGTTPARLTAFDLRTPRKQKVDKTILAKALNAWSELPDVVSMGGQKNFVRFMDGLPKQGDGWEPDEQYYRDTIAKVIILKRAERIARQIAFKAYRANAVCYTVSLLAYRTAGRVSLGGIWNNQEVSAALEATMREWMPWVHEEIVESAEGRNVTEWCKEKGCWTRLQSLHLDLAPGFEDELAEGVPLPNVGQFNERKGGAPRGLTAEERDRQARTMRLGPEDWLKIMSWARETGALNEFQLNLTGTILGYSAGGWRHVPSPRQTRHTVVIMELWEASGGDQVE
ncbi:AIPR family protein [Gemmatimonadota bacterium]